MMDDDFSIYGQPPTESSAEAAQFDRVLRALSRARDVIGPWCTLLLNHRFTHIAGSLIDGDVDWNGQMDILLFSEHKIVVYELKGFTAKIIYAKTDNSPWVVHRAASNEPEEVKSFFQQASKQRAFLQRDFLHRFDGLHPEMAENHWLVDARVVLKAGSDLSGFFYKVPLTETLDDLEQKVLSKFAHPADKAFVRNAFSGVEAETGKLQRIKLSHEDYDHLKALYRDNGIIPRTQKWFRLVAEDQLHSDLLQLGSLRFTLSKDIAREMVEGLLSCG